MNFVNILQVCER